MEVLQNGGPLFLRRDAASRRLHQHRDTTTQAPVTLVTTSSQRLHNYQNYFDTQDAVGNRNRGFEFSGSKARNYRKSTDSAKGDQFGSGTKGYASYGYNNPTSARHHSLDPNWTSSVETSVRRLDTLNPGVTTNSIFVFLYVEGKA